MTIYSRFPTLSLPKFLTESYSPLHDQLLRMHKPRLSFVAYSILLLGRLVVLVNLEVGGFSSSRNCTLVPMFSFLILPAGDENGCQCCAMWRISNWRQIGFVKSFHRLLHVSIGCTKCQSTRG